MKEIFKLSQIDKAVNQLFFEVEINAPAFSEFMSGDPPVKGCGWRFSTEKRITAPPLIEEDLKKSDSMPTPSAFRRETSKWASLKK